MAPEKKHLEAMLRCINATAFENPLDQHQADQLHHLDYLES